MGEPPKFLRQKAKSNHYVDSNESLTTYKQKGKISLRKEGNVNTNKTI